jgi:type II secretory pathway component PulC
MVSLKLWNSQDAGIALLEFALVVLLAASLAYWTSVAYTPRAIAVSDWPARSSAEQRGTAVKRHLFGSAPESVAQATAAASAGLRLLGVFSGAAPGKGRAIVAAQGARPQAVLAGEKIADGLVLQDVYPDHVIVLRNGVAERVDLERVPAPLTAAPLARPLPARR